MKVFIENRGHMYEAVPCGPQCGYSKKDGTDSLLSGFISNHCTKTCYCPKWWLAMTIDRADAPTGEFFGLRKVDKPKVNKKRNRK